MMPMQLAGRARILPDAVNTDYIISSRRKREIADLERLAEYLFEDLPRPLNGPLIRGDVVVAGEDFGCGSAMEVAVDVFKVVGVPCIVARSVARNFYRNAINAGLPVILYSGGEVAEGDFLSIVFDRRPAVANRTSGSDLSCRSVPDFAVQVVAEGGLLPYYSRYGMPRGRIG